jgi:hypothetical protein
MPPVIDQSNFNANLIRTSIIFSWPCRETIPFIGVRAFYRGQRLCAGAESVGNVSDAHAQLPDPRVPFSGEYANADGETDVYSGEPRNSVAAEDSDIRAGAFPNRKRRSDRRRARSARFNTHLRPPRRLVLHPKW